MHNRRYVNLTNEGFETRLYANLLMLNDAMRRLGRKSFPDVVRWR